MQILTSLKRKRAALRVLRNEALLRQASDTEYLLAKVDVYDIGLEAQINQLSDRLQRDREYLETTAPEA